MNVRVSTAGRRAPSSLESRMCDSRVSPIGGLVSRAESDAKSLCPVATPGFPGLEAHPASDSAHRVSVVSPGEIAPGGDERVKLLIDLMLQVAGRQGFEPGAA